MLDTSGGISIKKTTDPVLIYSGLYKGPQHSTVCSFEIGCVERSYPPSCFRTRAILPRDERPPDSGTRLTFPAAAEPEVCSVPSM